MAEIRQDVSIRGDNVQRIYSFFRDGKFIVNRRYQRKLVWNVEEKQKFIDSISKTYPVPLFLLATVQQDEREKYEIIDGMQRLNAICSFIEQEFGIHFNGDTKECYFDLETMAETKYLKDQGLLQQSEPVLDRIVCLRIANYPLPLSVYTIETTNEIDEIFRRINSGGRQLSHQEVRQSSSLGHFADSVRKIASKIRGDDSLSDSLQLNEMSKISVSNKQLGHYGIKVDDIFWVKQNILSREKLRQSIDEELVADALGSILLTDKFTSNKEILDNLYGIYSADSPAKTDRHDLLENNLSKNEEYWINVFVQIYDEIKQVVNHSGTNFNSLINVNAETSRYATKQFLTIFWALYELIILEKKLVSDYSQLAEKLKLAKNAIHIRGGYYSGKFKRANIDAVKGIINPTFRERAINEDNPADTKWFTKLESILMFSVTEQALCEFKQGFHKLSQTGEFNSNMVDKVIRTLTAMTNYEKGARGYVIIGVADNEEAAKRISEFYNSGADDPRVFNNFHITGIDSEVASYHNNDYDKYLLGINSQIKKQPVDQGFLHNNISIHSIKYYDKSLLIFEVKAADKPIYYGDKFYIRNSNENVEVKTKDFAYLYQKFLN